LHGVANLCRLEFCRMLLEHKAAINIPRDDGETPLHAASRNGHTEVVRLLLEHGADPHARDRNDQTPSDTFPTAKQEIKQLLSEYASNSVK